MYPALLHSRHRPGKMLQSAAAWAFVLIWSTGFVVARGISGHIDPYLFLLLRFTAVAILFGFAMIILRKPIPPPSQVWRLTAIGALTQGLYLGPAFWAVSQGLEAGIMALMGSLQPPVTALLAWYLFAERVTRLSIFGLVLGIIGVAMAVTPGIGHESQPMQETLMSSTPFGWVIMAGVLSIGAITAGTLMQRSSIISVPLLSSVTFQTLGAAGVTALMAALFAKPDIELTAATLGYLGWAIFVLSIGGFTLLTWLVRTGSATRASSLLFLVPPLAAILSWKLYGEQLGIWQIGGFALALTGVIVARRQV